MKEGAGIKKGNNIPAFFVYLELPLKRIHFNESVSRLFE